MGEPGVAPRRPVRNTPLADIDSSSSCGLPLATRCATEFPGFPMQRHWARSTLPSASSPEWRASFFPHPVPRSSKAFDVAHSSCYRSDPIDERLLPRSAQQPLRQTDRIGGIWWFSVQRPISVVGGKRTCAYTPGQQKTPASVRRLSRQRRRLVRPLIRGQKRPLRRRPTRLARCG